MSYEAIKEALSNPTPSKHQISNIERLLAQNANHLSEREAIELSLLHWEKNEWDPDTDTWSHGRNSAICALCAKYWVCCHLPIPNYDFPPDSLCPLTRISARCDHLNSPWRATACGDKKPMLKALRRLLTVQYVTDGGTAADGTRLRD